LTTGTRFDILALDCFDRYKTMNRMSRQASSMLTEKRGHWLRASGNAPCRRSPGSWVVERSFNQLDYPGSARYRGQSADTVGEPICKCSVLRVRALPEASEPRWYHGSWPPFVLGMEGGLSFGVQPPNLDKPARRACTWRPDVAARIGRHPGPGGGARTGRWPAGQGAKYERITHEGHEKTKPFLFSLCFFLYFMDVLFFPNVPEVHLQGTDW